MNKGQFIHRETSYEEIGRLTNSNHCRCVSNKSVSHGSSNLPWITRSKQVMWGWGENRLLERGSFKIANVMNHLVQSW